MKSYKAVAALLIAVFANPLCCCLSANASQSATHVAKADNHACCHSQQTEAERDLSGHDKQECQHQLQKDSKISQSPDSSDTLSKPLLLTTTFHPADLCIRASLEPQTDILSAKSIAVPKDAPTPQANCVYLL